MANPQPYPQPYPLVRERNIILVVLLGLSALGWGLLAWQVAHQGMSSMGLTMGMSAWLFLAIWIAMMVAMMFPSAGPMILMFAAISAGKRRQSQQSVPTGVFVGGYLFIWTLFGILAYALALGGDWLANRSPWVMDNAGRLGGIVLIAAGLYQLSPLKSVCLGKCRTPTLFMMTSWRDGYGGAIAMGMRHGAYCLGCCWALMVILFPLGMMNIAVLGIVAALIFMEKCLPVGQTISRLAGAALVLYGLVVIFVPMALPTMMS